MFSSADLSLATGKCSRINLSQAAYCKHFCCQNRRFFWELYLLASAGWWRVPDRGKNQPDRLHPLVVLQPQRLVRSLAQHRCVTPKHLLQNVISGILPSSAQRVYRLKIANFLRTFSHVGIFDPALWSVLSPLPLSPTLWFNTPPFPVWISTGKFMYTACGCLVV